MTTRCHHDDGLDIAFSQGRTFVLPAPTLGGSVIAILTPFVEVVCFVMMKSFFGGPQNLKKCHEADR